MVAAKRWLLNSKKILRNTAWYGLENVISFGSSLITSIAIARTLGPSQMGYIIYVIWLANIASSLGSVGIPATARKYMAEYLGAGDKATARHIYFRMLLIQIGLATLATGAGLAWVFRDSPPQFRVAAAILILSIWPAMVNFISAQANVASERLSANLPASIASTLTFFIGTVLTIVLHLGVIGIASAMFAMRFADFIVRVIPTLREIFSWPHPHGVELPETLGTRMVYFAWQSLVGMLLTLIVWDRSELFLLKHLSTDIRQIAFYSVAFNLAERLLVFPTVFAAASGASIYAQYGRDRTKIPGMVAATARYLGLTSIPLHFIAVALGGAALLTMYGNQYADAVAVAMLAPLLCLPKAFLGPIQSLFESTEEQKYFIWATIFASIVDVGVAWMLIPKYGAMGACLGSGLAQLIAVGSLWTIGIRRHKVVLPWAFLFKISGISAISSLAAYLFVMHLPPLWGLLSGSAVSILLFFGLLRVSGTLEEEDWGRVRVILDTCPRVVAVPARYTFSLLGLPISISPEAS
jgi:O-antigen/teichoic acid export membrane protein